jgi:primosomal protein N' (replication factor Y)
VQTLATGASAIRHAAGHDSAAFLAEELERRRALRYPPYSHLIEIGLSSGGEEPLDAAAEALRALVEERLEAEAELLGPAPLFRRRGRHRRRLLVKSLHRTAAVDAVRDAISAAVEGRALREVAVSVDVDPQ